MGFNIVHRAQETLAHLGTAFATQSWAHRWERKAYTPPRRSIPSKLRYHRKKLKGERCGHCGSETIFQYDTANTVCRTCGEIKPI